MTSWNQSNDVSRMIDALQRLREVRAAARRFLLLAAVENSKGYENLLRDVVDPYSRSSDDSVIHT